MRRATSSCVPAAERTSHFSSGLSASLPRSPPLDVLLDDIDTLDHDPVTVDQVEADFAALPLVPPARDKDLVARPNLSHVAPLKT